jgi:signal transduction histidine kinase
MQTVLVTVNIESEIDVVFLRQRARQIAALMQFDALDQTRISTSVSEIARNAFLYAKGGRAQFLFAGSVPERIVIRISDRGPGISELPAILAGHYHSTTGMGLGIPGSRKLMDTFDVDSNEGRGTIVEMSKTLPAHQPRATPELVALICTELAKAPRSGPLEEIREQNRELLRTLEDLKTRQLQIDQMYRELTEAHRQVVDSNSQLETEARSLQRTTAAERAARADAEAAIVLREDLLAIVSHDLRTPLSSILASATALHHALAKSRVDEAMIQKSTNIIVRSAQRMSRLVADLLDLAHIRTGALQIERRAVAVRDLIEETHEVLEPVAAQTAIRITWAAPDELWVSCDKERTLQILANLVSNAIKFSSSGGLICLEAVECGREVLLSVSDTGVGIPPESLPHVFDRYWQARHKQGGIGLGLSIVAGLVQANGGRVWAESERGIGSKFYFTLPRTEGPRANTPGSSRQQ